MSQLPTPSDAPRPSLLQVACTRPIVLAALKVALVVGSVLNLINQGSAVLEGQSPNLFQVLLNFVVPYCVSSYSAARNEIRRRSALDDQSASGA